MAGRKNDHFKNGLPLKTVGTALLVFIQSFLAALVAIQVLIKGVFETALEVLRWFKKSGIRQALIFEMLLIGSPLAWYAKRNKMLSHSMLGIILLVLTQNFHILPPDTHTYLSNSGG